MFKRIVLKVSSVCMCMLVCICSLLMSACDKQEEILEGRTKIEQAKVDFASLEYYYEKNLGYMSSVLVFGSETKILYSGEYHFGGHTYKMYKKDSYVYFVYSGGPEDGCIYARIDRVNYPYKISFAQAADNEQGYIWGEEVVFTEGLAVEKQILTSEMLYKADKCLRDARYIEISGYVIDTETGEWLEGITERDLDGGTYVLARNDQINFYLTYNDYLFNNSFASFTKMNQSYGTFVFKSDNYLQEGAESAPEFYSYTFDSIELEGLPTWSFY